jgi:ATP-dependent Lon protease
MKLNWVEQMDEVLEIALSRKLPKLAEEIPDALASGTPLPLAGKEPASNVAHQ